MTTAERYLGLARWTVAGLVAGRGLFRASQWLSGAALLYLWGPGRFAPYAVALGTTGWLLALTASGTEKAALNLGARAGGEWAWRAAVRVAVLPIATALLALSALTVVAPTSALWWYAAGATYATGVGTAVVAVALFRLWQRPAADAFAFGALAVSHAVAVGCAVLGYDAQAVLGILVVCVLAVDLGLIASAHRQLTHRSPSPPSRRSTQRFLAASTLLGAAEVFGMAGVAVLYLVLAATGQDAQTALLYLLMIASQAVSGLVLYLLRLAQPVISRRLETAPEHGLATAARIARRALVAGAPATALLLAGMVLTSAAAGPSVAVVVLVVALVAEIVLFATVSAAACVLENVGAAGRRWSAVAAAAAFVAVSLSGVALAPRFGAAGCLLALLIGLCVQAAGLILPRGGYRTKASSGGRLELAAAELAGGTRPNI